MIKLAVVLDGYSPRKDKSVSLRFITQEQTPEGIALIHGFIDTYGFLYFKPEKALTSSEMDELDQMDTDLLDKGKTQSKRLKNTLYVLWEQKPEGYEEFPQYYKAKTEKIIQHFKDKLE